MENWLLIVIIVCCICIILLNTLLLEFSSVTNEKELSTTLKIFDVYKQYSVIIWNEFLVSELIVNIIHKYKEYIPIYNLQLFYLEALMF
jgi:hypothetical protein